MRRLRWGSFALVCAAYVLSFFHRIAPNPMAGELRAAFDLSAAELGALAGSYFWLYTPMQVPTGVLVDVLGPRRIVALGGVAAGIGSIAFGRAESLAGATAVGRARAPQALYTGSRRAITFARLSRQSGIAPTSASVGPRSSTL